MHINMWVADCVVVKMLEISNVGGTRAKTAFSVSYAQPAGIFFYCKPIVALPMERVHTESVILGITTQYACQQPQIWTLNPRIILCSINFSFILFRVEKVGELNGTIIFQIRTKWGDVRKHCA